MSPAQSPSHRPTWLLVLASAMLLHGGLTLVGGLLTVRDPKAIATLAARNAGRTSVQPEVATKLAAIDDAVLERHRRGVRINAVAGIVFGLYTLYAVSAILSRDRHGRVLALGVAVLGGAHLLSGLPLTYAMAREAAAASAPVLAAAVAGPGIDPAEVARKVEASFLRPPILYTVMGLLWCLLIVVCFGGRRGRAVYGVRPR
jgi:hypothetical protein